MNCNHRISPYVYMCIYARAHCVCVCVFFGDFYTLKVMTHYDWWVPSPEDDELDQPLQPHSKDKASAHRRLSSSCESKRVLHLDQLRYLLLIYHILGTSKTMIRPLYRAARSRNGTLHPIANRTSLLMRSGKEVGPGSARLSQ